MEKGKLKKYFNITTLFTSILCLFSCIYAIDDDITIQLSRSLYSCLAPKTAIQRPILGKKFIKVADSFINIGIDDPLDGNNINNQPISDWLSARPELQQILFDRFSYDSYSNIGVQVRNYYSSRGIRKVRELIDTYANNYLVAKEAEPILSLLHKKDNNGQFVVQLKHLHYANHLYLKDLYIRKGLRKKVSKKSLPEPGSLDEKYARFLRRTIAKACNAASKRRRFPTIKSLLNTRLWDLPIFAVNSNGNISEHAMKWVISDDISSYQYWKQQFLGYGTFQKTLKSLAEITDQKNPPITVKSEFNFDDTVNKQEKNVRKKYIIKKSNPGKKSKNSWVIIRQGKQYKYQTLYDLWRSIFHEIYELLNEYLLMDYFSKEIKTIESNLTTDKQKQILLFPDVSQKSLTKLKTDILNLRKKLGEKNNPNWSKEKQQFFMQLFNMEQDLNQKNKLDMDQVREFFKNIDLILNKRIANVENMLKKIKKGRLDFFSKTVKNRNEKLLNDIDFILKKVNKMESVKSVADFQTINDILTRSLFHLITNPELKDEPEFYRINNLLYDLKNHLLEKNVDFEYSYQILKKIHKMFHYSNWLYSFLNQFLISMIDFGIRDMDQKNFDMLLRNQYFETLKSLNLLSSKYQYERVRGWIKIKFATSFFKNPNLRDACQFLIWILDLREGVSFPLRQIGKKKRTHSYNYLKTFKDNNIRLEFVDIEKLLKTIIIDYKLNKTEKVYLFDMLLNDNIVMHNFISFEKNRLQAKSA